MAITRIHIFSCTFFLLYAKILLVHSLHFALLFTSLSRLRGRAGLAHGHTSRAAKSSPSPKIPSYSSSLKSLWISSFHCTGSCSLNPSPAAALAVNGTERVLTNDLSISENVLLYLLVSMLIIQILQLMMKYMEAFASDKIALNSPEGFA